MRVWFFKPSIIADILAINICHRVTRVFEMVEEGSNSSSTSLAWAQVGGDIVGEEIAIRFGASVLLALDGTSLAMGEPQATDPNDWSCASLPGCPKGRRFMKGRFAEASHFENQRTTFCCGRSKLLKR